MLGVGVMCFILGIIFIEASFNHWKEYESHFFAGCVAACGIILWVVAFICFSLV